jgi:hypothetical protein
VSDVKGAARSGSETSLNLLPERLEPEDFNKNG